MIREAGRPSALARQSARRTPLKRAKAWLPFRISVR